MSELIKKIKEKGLKKSIRMISVKMKKQEKYDKSSLSKERSKVLEKVMDCDFETVIIFENHFGYYNIMLQRPQHITRELSDERTLVLYNSYYDVDYKDNLRITRIKTNCYVLDMYYYRQAILQKLHDEKKKKVLMVYSTDTVPVSRIEQYEEEDFSVLYEYVDDINPKLIAPKKLDMVMQRHNYLVNKKTTLIVATATRLYENILQQNRDAHVELISNGVECTKFPVNMKTDDQEYLTWIKKNRIKVGYYGALANWVDYALLRELVADKQIQLILIGVEHDQSLMDSGLLQNENVRYFGKKPYDKLAGYAHYFDVCIIPFVINDITLATSPVKLFEYMALGKPVVTTPMPECLKYEYVKIAANIKEFREKIYEAAEQAQDEQYKAALIQCAYENDWKVKAQEIKLKFDI